MGEGGGVKGRAKEYEVTDVLRIIATLSLSDKQILFQHLKESIALGDILCVCFYPIAALQLLDY